MNLFSNLITNKNSIKFHKDCTFIFITFEFIYLLFNTFTTINYKTIYITYINRYSLIKKLIKIKFISSVLLFYSFVYSFLNFNYLN